ncbi:MAG: helical backbone metal receptor [Novosphingobium sp.]|nr:helical backbone metal receptor [Novosphingobium sp.]
MLPALGLVALALYAPAAAAPRVASINLCTDQLLLDLADPQQIVGLGPFARDQARSWAATRGAGFPILSGTAEEILVLKPDLVVAGRNTRQTTRAFLRARSIVLEEFEAVRTIEEAKQQILRMARLLGAPERGVARAGELDAAVARLKAVASRQRWRVLPLARRGWVPGGQSVISDLLRLGGLVNVGSEASARAGRFVSLEEIVMLRPDLLLVSAEVDHPEDQGQALVLHPAIADKFPPERRLVLSEALTVCGGPGLIDAVNVLAERLSALRLDRR